VTILTGVGAISARPLEIRTHAGAATTRGLVVIRESCDCADAELAPNKTTRRTCPRCNLTGPPER
jgi:hypothetical protein